MEDSNKKALFKTLVVCLITFFVIYFINLLTEFSDYLYHNNFKTFGDRPVFLISALVSAVITFFIIKKNLIYRIIYCIAAFLIANYIIFFVALMIFALLLGIGFGWSNW